MSRILVDGVEVAILSAPNKQAARADLSEAELDVCSRLLRGDSNRAIADARGTSVRTVANQVATIFRKLEVSSRSELIAKLL